MRRKWLLVLATTGCVDESVPIPPLSGGAPATKLSQLGLFAGDPTAQRPATGVVPYDVIAPLWSDGASKHRFIAAPVPLQASDDFWAIPRGTYLVKTFWFPRDERDPTAQVQLVETRVIAFLADDTWMSTYVWNAEQTDAEASGGNLDIAIDQIDASGAARHHVHHVPGTSQCDSCHKSGALGIRSPQLHDQLAALVTAGVVDRAPEVEPFVDPYGAAPLQPRAISYLDVNCSECHRPGGDAQGTNADWRREHVLDNVCRAARHSVDGHALVIAPGKPAESVMIARMRSGDPFIHMPRGPSHIVDERAVAMLEAWIASLPGCP